MGNAWFCTTKGPVGVRLVDVSSEWWDKMRMFVVVAAVLFSPALMAAVEDGEDVEDV